jgi:hypothetical protein
MPVTIEDILSPYDATISTIGFQLRDFLLQHLKDIIEQPDAPANIIGYNYGTGYKTLICTIIPSKKGIKLGFNRGNELPDPTHLLEGSGKVHKYVVIKSVTGINNPRLLDLLKEAIKAYNKRIAIRSGSSR